MEQSLERAASRGRAAFGPQLVEQPHRSSTAPKTLSRAQFSLSDIITPLVA